MSAEERAGPPERRAAPRAENGGRRAAPRASNGDRRTALRDSGLVLAIAAVGALGALPGSRSGPDPIALLAWLSLWAVPAGFACGALGLALWPLPLAVPGSWMALVALVDAGSARDLPAPVLAALCWSGLFALGLGIGRLAPRALVPGIGVLLLLGAALAALPGISGALAQPLSPALRARLLDLSPATLVIECAGVDWMRHPAVYATAGTFDIDPALRSAWRGELAGPVALALGCLAALGGAWIARALPSLQRRPGCG